MDEILDFIGINWPNVDEDDYREMADAMREFADTFEHHGGEALAAVNRVIASSEGSAVDLLSEHWGKVRSSHLEQVPEVTRLFATACDVVADVIYGMKTKAEIELGVMAASVGISIGLAVVTGGLSALIGAAETAAMRELIRRIIKEAQEEIIDRLLAEVTEPITGKLERMAEDMVLDIADEAFSLPPSGAGAGSGAGADGGSGHGAMRLNSAGGGGGGGGGGGRVVIDHDEYESGAERLALRGRDLQSDGLGSLGRAKGAFGRTKGRDPFTQAFDSILHGALEGTEKALKKVGRHLGENVPNGLRTTSRNHRRNEEGLVEKFGGIGASDKSGGRPAGGSGRPSGKPGDGSGSSNSPSPELSRKAREDRDRCKGGDPIDMATGEVLLTQVELELPGVLPLVIERTHLSGYRHGRFFGPSWASTFDERLEQADASGELWWHRPDGSSKRYPSAPDLADEQVMPREGHRLPLTRVQGTDGWDLAVTDPETRLTRRFLPPVTGPAAGEHTAIWWLADITDRNGNTISFHREEDGAPIALVHSGGYHVLVDVHGPERAEEPDQFTSRRVARLAVRDDEADGGVTTVTTHTYDDAGNLEGVVNSSGLPLRFGYDDEHRMTSWTDRNGFTFRYEYDADGRVARAIGPDGCLSGNLVYDPAGRWTRYTDSTGATTRYEINELGQVTAVTDPLGHTWHTEWDRYDNVCSRTDPLGNTTRLERDEWGAIVVVHRPDGTRTDIVHDPQLRLPVEIREPDGAVWRHEYDVRGNLTARIAPDGSAYRLTHGPTGAVKTLTDPLGRTSAVETDPAGLVVSVTDPRGHRTSCVRDAFGRSCVVTEATGDTTRMEWTVEGLPRRRTAADGTTESWEWDAEGNCLAHTDPCGSRTEWTYGPFDRATARTAPDGGRHTFRYDTELRLTEVTAPGDLAWTYTYDAAGQQISETDFDGRTTHYNYDAAGRPTGRTTPAGDTIVLSLDSLGRTVAKDAAGVVTSYTYDAAGRVTSAVSPTSSLHIAYDSLGRVVSETVEGRTTAFSYDAAGCRTGRTTPSGVETTLAYDEVGNRTELALGGRALAFTYDPVGRELSRAFPGRAGTRITSSWDPVSRLARRTLAANDHILRDRSHSYRSDGYLEKLTEHVSNDVKHVSLDPVGRPLEVTAPGRRETYAYEQNGNQARADWSGMPADGDAAGERTYSGTQLLSAGRVHYTHDAAGRIIERRKTRISRRPDIWRYTYDAEDRLTSCTTPDGTVWRYRYDPLGRRTAKQRMAADGVTVAEETVFSWDLMLLAEQSNPATGVTITWEHEGHQPLAQYEHKPTPDDDIDSRFYAIVTDLVGTPTELVDESGTIAWETRATCWGTTAWNENATAYTPLRFPGQYYDPETGLHYNWFRHYDPETARYTSPDPLGLEPAPNPFAYVINPMAWIDLLGLLTCKENAKILRQNMANEGRAPGPGQAAAHIVPSGGQHGHWAPGKRARDLLQQYGVDINDAANGIPLDHPTPHNYTHRGAYLTRLDAHLQTVVNDLITQGHSTQSIGNALRSELRSIGSAVQSELATGAPGPSAIWTAP
ncbi:DUF6531 domain-containing protein [Streptomyces sp. NPDC051243]|uniref:DUF6531 domain-containing protein n=1 Tax=Streptomyces sp. NPDC051243 TaxID=3365646 RepID=UPI003798959E